MCLGFENGFLAEGGSYIYPIAVARVPGELSKYAAQFTGDPSRIEIPYFTNNDFGAFTFSLWYKRTDTSSG